MTTPEGRTALYRLYNDRDELLYVGITSNPNARFAQHAAEKDWWPAVVRRDVEWYRSRRSALASEEAAIKAKVPRHNREHSPIWPRIPVTVTISEAQAKALDAFCRLLRIPSSASTGEQRDAVLWCLLDRELNARGLLGDPACHHSSIPWPDGVAVERAGEPCSCGRMLTADCSPWADPPAIDAAPEIPAPDCSHGVAAPSPPSDLARL